MTQDQKKNLERQLWNIADQLRGKMNADEFRDYCLGFIFFKYLSERLHRYANDILSEDGVDFVAIEEGNEDGEEMLAAIQEEAVAELGYFLRPSELFHTLAARAAQNPPEFILDDLTKVLNAIERSTMGTESEDDFDELFEDLDLTSTKLGRTEEAKNELIAKILVHLDKVDFRLDDGESDVLGDAYEYLIGQFASGAGKKAGEFYTPQQVSTVIARLVTTGKRRLKSVYDPTCGSGSLLLRVARELSHASGGHVGDFYGQEMNRTTYNLARMNMILHGVHYRNFDLKQEDTLERPQHMGMKFEAVVANPPFSAKWSANKIFESDDRFAMYGRLAPKSKADFAFVQHMLHHLDENGTMAVVLPHGALFRGGAEGVIRRYLIETQNWLDAVIGLPANVFYGTSIPTCILVFKKCREQPDDVLFVDASADFGQVTNQNILRPEDIDKIVTTFRERKAADKYSYVATLGEIAENDYNLNIPRYVDTFEEEEPVDLVEVTQNLANVYEVFEMADLQIAKFCDELNLPIPVGNNAPLLKEYKRGVMQKIFSGELRFRRDDGRPFPDWETKKLSALATRQTAKNTDDDIRRVLTNSATQGVLDQRDYFDKDIANANNLGGYYIVEQGDYVYNPRISVHAPVGPLNKNKVGRGVMSPLYSVIRFRSKENDFYEQYFQTSFWHRYMSSVANYGARHDRMNITTADFMAMPLPAPVPEEQRKIADFLSAIDNKTTAVDQQIEQIETFKKGLLQQMFV